MFGAKKKKKVVRRIKVCIINRSLRTVNLLILKKKKTFKLLLTSPEFITEMVKWKSRISK